MRHARSDGRAGNIASVAVAKASATETAVTAVTDPRRFMGEKLALRHRRGNVACASMLSPDGGILRGFPAAVLTPVSFGSAV
jgi:hypothetical protein